MPYRMADMKPLDPVYTFIHDSGENIHLATNPIRDYIDRVKPDGRWCAIDGGLALSFITENIVSPARVKELAKRTNLTPIIMGLLSPRPGWPDGLLIDGHHRYFLAWAAKLDAIPAYFLPESVWREFQITDHPSFDQDLLRALPVTERSY